MPQITLTAAIILSVGTLLLGFVIAFLFQNGKISAEKKENAFLKAENEKIGNEAEQNRKKIGEMTSEISEKERELAIRETVLKTEIFRREEAETEAGKLREEKAELSARLSKAMANEAAAQQSYKDLSEWINKAENGLKDSFASISKNITENNNKVFLETANDKVGGIVTPVSNELKELRAKVEELEQKRVSAYSVLNKSVEDLQKQNGELKNATDLLNSTLKNNAQRGKWGEEQLRRIAELAGMVEHIDFEEQEVNAEGSRPDMVIHLTGGRSVPVDSKAPMNSYLAYLDDTDESARAKHLSEHVKALRSHIDTLFRKAYWKNEERSVEMVAMVVPYESGLSAAFATDREIFSYAMEKNVLLLSPMTFYAFLKSVSIGWQENAMSQNAKEIAKQSRELIKRFEVFYGHFDKIDNALSNARTAFDKAVSSYNSRLLPSFNRFRTLSNGTGEEQELLEENYSE
ncbi:MAG: DNA recombination protein RmuC [Oscillospiraceae bacterium]|nr:DNA recombination protein RmuC [Oscillospiraceae bacterium]